MGDRANVKIRNQNGSVFLYTHWDGSELPDKLQRALKRHQRWDDSAYLTRIIFCEMVRDDIDGETGFGISTNRTMDDRPILIVDCSSQRVAVGDRADIEIRSVSFEEFCEMSDAELDRFVRRQ
jgi:hypothetical protein